MVAAEVAPLQSDASLRTPQHEKSSEAEDGKTMLGTTTGPRRPRNREVTSRYKCFTTSVSPAPTPNRRFPSPNVDRYTALPDAASPKRAQSAERRRPSPARSTESKVSNGSLDATTLPKRPPVRSELWPSTRSLSSSMQGEPCSLPSNGQSKVHVNNGRGKVSSLTSDHTLRPSANVVPRPADHRKPTPERKCTPLRNQNVDQVENAWPSENVHKSDHHRRPGNSNGKISGAAMSRSMDLSGDRDRPLSRAASFLVQGKSGIGASRVPRPIASSRAFSQSINEGSAHSSGSQQARAESRGRSRDSPLRSSKGSNKDSLPRVSLQNADSTIEQVVQPRRQSAQAVELASADASPIIDNSSDTESVSSGCTTITSSSRGTPGGCTGARTVRGTTVPARFWPDASSRSLRASESNRLRSSMPEPDLSSASVGKSSNKFKVAASSEISSASNLVLNGHAMPSPWIVSPNRSISAFLPPQQPLSPVRTSPYRNRPSPVRTRGLPLPSQVQRSSSAAVMLNFGADTRKGKKGLTQIEEAHLHRIFHNRYLQWRFVNARAEQAMNSQIFAVEKSLYNVCARIFELRSSVTTKRIRLQQARQAHKLDCLLSNQVPKLEDWSSLQCEHSGALTGAVHALEAAVLRVPVTGGVKADTMSVKEAINSAYDVMNSVENSVSDLLPKAEKTNSLVSELAYVAAQERVLLDECADLIATASALEMEECSMRTHLVQLEQERARVLGHLMDKTSAVADLE